MPAKRCEPVKSQTVADCEKNSAEESSSDVLWKKVYSQEDIHVDFKNKINGHILRSRFNLKDHVLLLFFFKYLLDGEHGSQGDKFGEKWEFS